MILEEKLTEKIIGAAVEVHRHLGPGLLESTYEECLCHQLNLYGLSFERQKELPVDYKGVKLNCGYRIDVIVKGRAISEIRIRANASMNLAPFVKGGSGGISYALP